MYDVHWRGTSTSTLYYSNALDARRSSLLVTSQVTVRKGTRVKRSPLESPINTSSLKFGRNTVESFIADIGHPEKLRGLSRLHRQYNDYQNVRRFDENLRAYEELPESSEFYPTVVIPSPGPLRELSEVAIPELLLLVVAECISLCATTGQRRVLGRPALICKGAWNDAVAVATDGS